MSTTNSPLGMGFVLVYTPDTQPDDFAVIYRHKDGWEQRTDRFTLVIKGHDWRFESASTENKLWLENNVFLRCDEHGTVHALEKHDPKLDVRTDVKTYLFYADSTLASFIVLPDGSGLNQHGPIDFDEYLKTLAHSTEL